MAFFGDLRLVRLFLGFQFRRLDLRLFHLLPPHETAHETPTPGERKKDHGGEKKDAET